MKSSLFMFAFICGCLSIEEKFLANVKEIRSQIQKKAEANSSLFHPDDVKYLTEDDWPILRFLIDTRNNQQEALKRIEKALTWRLSFGIHKPLDQYPVEFFRSNDHFFCGKSIAGRLLLQVKSASCQVNTPLEDLVIQFATTYWDGVDRKSGSSGADLVIDCDGLDHSYVSPKILRIIVEANEHYPTQARNVYVYRFPWIFKTLWGIIKAFLNNRQLDVIKFVDDKNELLKYVSEDQLAKDIGGNNDCKETPPDGAESGVCRSKFVYGEDQWKDYYNRCKESFKKEAKKMGVQAVADLFNCRNSTGKEIIKKLID